MSLFTHHEIYAVAFLWQHSLRQQGDALISVGRHQLATARRSLHEGLGTLWRSCGITTEWMRLRNVLLHRLGDELLASADFSAVNMLAPLELGRAQAQHEEMSQAYRDAGVAVCYAEPPTA